jgi:organic radical activating enzyme
MKVLGRFSLNEIEQSVNDLYRLLTPLIKDAYEPEERIVFYGYEFDADIRQHITNVCNDLDIDEWFIEYEIGVEPHSKNRSSMIPLPYEFCPLPWISSQLRQVIKPCCIISDDGYPPVEESTIAEAYFSPNAIQLRESFRKRERNPACKKCWTSIDSGHLSPLEEHKKFHRFDYQHLTFEDESINNLIAIEVETGNLCNLKCRNCIPVRSSKIATEQIKERKELGLDYTILQQYNRQGQTYKDGSFWEDIAESLSNTRHIHIEGGEPFVTSDVQAKMLEYLVNANLASNIRLSYVTNGTIYPNELVDYWTHFQKVEISVSIDNIGNKFNVEREGAVWDEVVENLKKFIELEINVSIYLTVSAMNILDLLEIDDYLTQFNIPAHYTNVSTNPFGLVLLPQTARDLAIQRLSTREKFSGLVDIIKQLPPPETEVFNERMGRLDRLRNTNFSDTHKELCELMNYRQHD